MFAASRASLSAADSRNNTSILRKPQREVTFTKSPFGSNAPFHSGPISPSNAKGAGFGGSNAAQHYRGASTPEASSLAGAQLSAARLNVVPTYQQLLARSIDRKTSLSVPDSHSGAPTANAANTLSPVDQANHSALPTLPGASLPGTPASADDSTVSNTLAPARIASLEPSCVISSPLDDVSRMLHQQLHDHSATGMQSPLTPHSTPQPLVKQSHGTVERQSLTGMSSTHSHGGVVSAALSNRHSMQSHDGLRWQLNWPGASEPSRGPVISSRAQQIHPTWGTLLCRKECGDHLGGGYGQGPLLGRMSGLMLCKAEHGFLIVSLNLRDLNARIVENYVSML